MFRVGRRLYVIIYFPQESGMLQEIRRINVDLESFSGDTLTNLFRERNLTTEFEPVSCDATVQLMHERRSLYDSIVRQLGKHGFLSGKGKPEEWSAERWQNFHQIWDNISRGKSPWLEEGNF